MTTAHLSTLPPLPGWSEPALWTLVVAVLVLPLAVHAVEENIEAFLLVAGAVSASISFRWSRELALEAVHEPLPITVTVLLVGLAFHFGRPFVDRAFIWARRRLPLPTRLFILVAGLGLLSSVITAIIASLILVEAINFLRLGRKQEVSITVLACFSIGLGAALTPLGEPLSTIATAKLHGDFWFLARLLGWWILPGILAVAAVAAFGHPAPGGASLEDVQRTERLSTVFIRAAKVFVFVGALVLLGAGFTPLADRYISRLPAPALFWCNTLSAVLDNATLAAAELTPSLTPRQLSAALLSLLVSGGLLIPGNIPNIVAASHLRIKSGEWARTAALPGIALLLAYFVAWMFLG